MKKYLISLILIGGFTLFSINTEVYAQLNSEGNGFLSRTTFQINTTLLSQNSGPSNVQYFSDEQNELFYRNPSFGIEMDYAITDNVSLNAGLSYTGSSITRENGIVFVRPPNPDAITNFKTDYQFTNLAFEPKVKVTFELHKFDFFWSAGPILSLAYLNTNIDGAPHGNPTNFRDLKSSRSHSFGLGGEASTGIQYFMFHNLGISAEVGYRYLSHNSLHSVQEYPNEEFPVDYTQQTFIQRFGIVFRL